MSSEPKQNGGNSEEETDLRTVSHIELRVLCD